jgi:AraC-like DNA-binding protein
MDTATLGRLLELLDVRVDAFAMCEIENGCSLVCDPVEMIMIHFVLRGKGSISWEGGHLELTPNMVAIIPPRIAKQINGAGPSTRSVPADAACPLVSGLVRFRACSTGEADLVLGCATIEARVRGGPRLFDHLREPFAEQCGDDQTGHLFGSILGELSSPGMGTKSMVGTMMKQIMILLLRTHTTRLGAASPLGAAIMHPGLTRSLLAILDSPQSAHSLDSLAAVAGMSRSRFVHHFSLAYGRTPMELVQSARLQAAARMLAGSALPVKTVAATVGYSSRSHFSHAFRIEFGLDPTAYRQEGRTALPTLGDGTNGDGAALYAGSRTGGGKAKKRGLASSSS